MEEVPAKEDEAEDDEEISLQVRATSQPADCDEPGKTSSFSFPSNILCREMEDVLVSYVPGDLTAIKARARPRYDSRDRGSPSDPSKYGGVWGCVPSGLRFKPFREWFHFEVVHTVGLRGSKEYG